MTKKDKVTVDDIIGIVKCEQTDSVEEVRKLRGRTNERFMIDDAGTLIDMVTRNTYDYVSDVCELLNDLHKKNNELRLQLNLCSDQRNEFHRAARENANRVGKLKKENEQLKSENQRLSEQKHIDFVKDCTAIEEELSNLKCANKKLLKSNDFLLKEHEKLTSVNQELRNELKFDEEMYKTFKEIIDEADDLITSHLSKHYQRQWKNFCKHRGVLDD